MRGHVHHLGNSYAEPGRNGWAFVLPQAEGLISLALVPGGGSSLPRYRTCGACFALEMDLPSGRPHWSLRIRLDGRAHVVSQLQRFLHRELNGRHSGLAIAGMLLLLAVCGWIADGEDGARKAVAFGLPKQDDLAISPKIMARRFGAKLLSPAKLSAVFARLYDICRRARLPRPPDLYHLPLSDGMNAYALGGPYHSAIVLTDGLLHRMTDDEVGGILAHEVAHIANNDGFAMEWASSLQRAVAITALAGLASKCGAWSADAPLAVFLRSAPSLCQLLYLALSRVRELDADARALDLIDRPQALITALGKLEQFHASAQLMPLQAMQEDVARWLRSHPTTWQRVGLLAQLAC
jgi:heat shock protein HtpX